MTPTPTLSESAADSLRAQIARRVVLAMQFQEFGHRATAEEVTKHPDGFANVGDWVSTTVEIDRLQKRAETAADAIIPLLALASCSTQTEGERTSLPIIMKWAKSLQKGLREHLALHQLHSLAKSIDAAPKPFPQPDAAASGDMGDYMPIEGTQETRTLTEQEVNKHLGQVCRSLAAQAMAQALEEAAKVVKRIKDSYASEPDAFACLGMAEDDIRALIPQPSAQAGERIPKESPTAKCVICKIEGADESEPGHVWINIADSTYAGTRVSVHRDCVREFHKDSPSQPEPESTQGGEPR